MPADTTIGILQSVDLEGMVIGSDGKPQEDNSLSWSSDNVAVASVNGSGHVQAGLAVGSTTITASRTGNAAGKAGTAKVTVVLVGP
jgi:hypothetical protein